MYKYFPPTLKSRRGLPSLGVVRIKSKIKNTNKQNPSGIKEEVCFHSPVQKDL